MADKILYTLVSRSGGVDGRDFTDKGGSIRLATFDKRVAETSSVRNWCYLEKSVIDVQARKAEALAKLDLVDRLVLGLVLGFD